LILAAFVAVIFFIKWKRLQSHTQTHKHVGQDFDFRTVDEVETQSYYLSLQSSSSSGDKGEHMYEGLEERKDENNTYVELVSDRPKTNMYANS